MKTQSLPMIAQVARLASIIEMRKTLDKEEKALKTELKAFMGTEAMLDAGDYCVLISGRSRKDLDKAALEEDLGQEFIQKYSKVVSYETVEVKPKSRMVTP